MSLPWVRLDSNIASHDKILSLLQEKQGTAAAWMFVCSLGYAGGHGTDGHIPFSALPFIHGKKTLGDLLVKHELWEPEPNGWRIRRWDKRQQSSATADLIRSKKSEAGRAGAHARWSA